MPTSIGRPRGLVWALFALTIACDEGIGGEGTQFPQTLPSLQGGVIFASYSVDGAHGYDLFWAPFNGVSSVGEQGYLQLTSTSADETQPRISHSGNALVFARSGEGIFYANAEGAIHRVSDTRDTNYVDSLPAVSADGYQVAWVREDTSRSAGNGFLAAEIWIANADGSNARAVNPKSGVVQDAPAFDPNTFDNRLAWSEFNANTFAADGPKDYGVWVHDLSNFTGYFACQGAYYDDTVGTLRCFGQHLIWPESDTLILPQQMLEISPTLRAPTGTRFADLVNGLASAAGTLDRTSSAIGFFPPFPLSASYAGTEVIIDGIFIPFDGGEPTVAFFKTTYQMSAPTRLKIATHQGEYDLINTAAYAFSLATPQLVPAQ